MFPTEIIFIFILAFFLRSIILFKNKWVGIDTLYHLVNANLIRKNKKIAYKFENLIYASGKSALHFYPPLLHKFLSFFPKKYHHHLRFLSPSLEIISMILLLMIVWNYLDYNMILISLLAYALTPLLIVSSWTISPRIPGNLFLTISMILLFLYFSYSNFIFLILFLLPSIGIILMHRFTTQPLVILTVVQSIFFKNIFPILFLILSFYGGFFITKGAYKKILKNHIKKLKYYYKVGTWRKLDKKRPENPIKIFMTFPFMLIIFFYIFVNGFSGDLIFFQVWFFSMLVVSFFWCIGSGFRYVISAAFPGSILIGKFFEYIPYQNLILATCLGFSAVGIFIIINDFKNKIRSKNAIKCLRFIEKHGKKNDIVVTFPIDYWHCVLYFTNKTVLVMDKDVENKIMKYGRHNEHKINWILTNDSEKMKKNNLYKKVFSCDNFHVFKLK